MQGSHKKHGKDIKAKFGQYGRNELAIMGATCGVIQLFASEIIGQLFNEIAMGYLDADHAEIPDVEYVMQNGAIHSAINKKKFFEHTTVGERNQLHPKLSFASADLVLINGNHFEGEYQLVILDERKTDLL